MKNENKKKPKNSKSYKIKNNKIKKYERDIWTFAPIPELKPHS